MAYDLDLCRLVGAWTGKFTTPMNLMSRGEYPTALGEAAFTTGAVPGFGIGEANGPWKDPRPEPFGPLPPGQARFKGFYVNGAKRILRWDVGGKACWKCRCSAMGNSSGSSMANRSRSRSKA